MPSIRMQCASILFVASLVLTAPADAQTLAITGATIIDGTGRAPVSDGVIVIEGGRITSVGRAPGVKIPGAAKKIDARGKYVIPGLMDANVHLSLSHNLNVETLIRFEDRFDEIVVESAQVALKNGLTTVFDTWGQMPATMKARDRINAGQAQGSRIYLAGNVIGSDGLFAGHFLIKSSTENVSKGTQERIDARYAQGVGSRLQLMTPDQVRAAVREYIGKGVDFLKYQGDIGATIFFSPRVQKAIIDEGHRANMAVQAHITSAEEMHVAIEAGIDIITHGEMPIPPNIWPPELIREMVEKNVAVSVLPFTQRRLDAMEKYSTGPTPSGTDLVAFYKSGKVNRRNMIKAGVRMLLSTDAYLNNPDILPEPVALQADVVDPDRKIGEAHFNAVVALEEEGMDRMEILKVATSNIAKAYRVDANLGTLEAGKIADMVILDANPLESARNYRKISAVIKDGKVVDRDPLPLAPLITAKK